MSKFSAGCSTDSNAPCITTGDEVLKLRSFDESNFPMDCVGMLSLYFAFHVGAFLSLLVKSRK